MTEEDMKKLYCHRSIASGILRSCIGSACMAYSEHWSYVPNPKRTVDSDEPIHIQQVRSYCSDLASR